MSVATVKVGSRHGAAPWAAHLLQVGARVVAAVAAMHRAAIERRELLALDERELRDIGITRTDAIRVAERPLWRSAPVRADDWTIGRA